MLTPSAEPSFDFPARSLEANLAALALSMQTRELVRAATPRGHVVRLPDGVPALAIGNAMLGMQGDLRSRERTLADIASQEGGVVVVFGLGLGHTVRELRARTRAKIIVYEPDPGVLRRVLEWGPSDLVGVPIVTDLLELGALWPVAARGRTDGILVRTPGYELLYPDAGLELEDMLRRLVTDAEINENTYFYRSRIWLADILSNLPRAVGATPFMALANHYRGVPAFIVGAGPSLDKNGALLREAVKKGIVIAVNSSALALARLGVVPQVLACLESIDLSKELARVPFIDQVVRAFSLSGHLSHFGVGKGPLLPIFENIPSFEPLVRLLGLRGLSVGASVTTAAFSLAERLGCNPIVLVGQDLAFTENQVYASGTAYAGSSVKISRDGTQVEHDWAPAVEAAHGTSQGALPRASRLVETAAWGGKGTVASSPMFGVVRAWLETAAEVLGRSRPDLSFINATEGGGTIERFGEISLGQVLSSMPDRALTSLDIACAAERTGSALTPERLAIWAAEQRELAAKVKGAAVALGELAVQAEREIAGDESAAMARTFAKIDQAEEELRRCSAEQPFVEAWCCSDLQVIQRRSAKAAVENSSRQNALHALGTEAEISGVIARAAGVVETHLGALENNPKPDNPI